MQLLKGKLLKERMLCKVGKESLQRRLVYMPNIFERNGCGIYHCLRCANE
jgi:hypothetical protein